MSTMHACVYWVKRIESFKIDHSETYRCWQRMSSPCSRRNDSVSHTASVSTTYSHTPSASHGLRLCCVAGPFKIRRDMIIMLRCRRESFSRTDQNSTEKDTIVGVLSSLDDGHGVRAFLIKHEKESSCAYTRYNSLSIYLSLDSEEL